MSGNNVFDLSQFTFDRTGQVGNWGQQNAPAGQLNLSSLYNYGTGGPAAVDPMSMASSFGSFGATGPGGTGPSTLQQIMGYSTNNGNYVPGYAGVAANLGLSAWQTKVAADQSKAFRDSVDFEKQRFKANYESQKKNYNTSLEDRQRARVAANPTGYQSVDAYMNKNALG